MSDSSSQPVDTELLVRYFSEETTTRENNVIEQWLNANDQNKKEFNALKLLWEVSSKAKGASSVDVKNDWQKVKNRIGTAPEMRSMPPNTTGKGSVFSRLIKVAAVVTLIVAAYLTWPMLSDFTSTEMITITALTDTSTVILSDGSKIVLNKNSRLIYPEQFDGTTRTVTLKGEAFFDVVGDPSRPFLITSGQATTEVVGTSFSVNAGIKNKVLVTVVTGKVLLYSEGNQEKKLSLVPGEQGLLKNGLQLSKTVNEDINFLSWKTGTLIFQNTSIDEVIRDLNKYYNKSLKISSSALKSCTLTATFKQQSFEDVLTELQLVLPIQVQNNERNIILTGVGCK
ncbi:MAG: FecR domain-containing protein [Bacteroidota bacterium]